MKLSERIGNLFKPKECQHTIECADKIVMGLKHWVAWGNCSKCGEYIHIELPFTKVHK